MYIRIISFGTNWWTMHSPNSADTLRYRRKVAYFNAAALMSGRRLHHSALLLGQIRFNCKSGFDPEFPTRSLGKVFLCSEPRKFEEKVHLLVERPARGMRPDAFLVTINSEQHGSVDFHSLAWKSPSARALSIARRANRYEAMLLLQKDDWVESDLGRWRVDPTAGRLELAGGTEASLS
jgi:hypothetical protein